MEERLRSRLAVGLAVSLGLNGLLAIVLLLGRSPAPALGQTADGASDFILGTERSAENPMCFVLRNKDPHLLVYKVDPTGKLIFLDSRDIRYDLMVVDGFFGSQAGTTLPSVAQVKKLVEKNAKDRPAAKDPESSEEK